MVRRYVGPGPGKYMLPPVTGYRQHDFTRYRNPEYSMGIKTPMLGSKAVGPGPVYSMDQMTRFGKASPPAYSIKSRPKALASFQAPGPGTYAPELAPRMKEPRPPAYSIRSRNHGFRPFVTPGPDKYEVPSTLGPKVPDLPANPGYSMSFKHSLSSKEQSPGPAKYNATNTDTYKNKNPNYTISPRVFPPNKQGQNPGPIYLPKLPTKPGYSFGLKTDTDPYVTAADEVPCANTKTC